MSNEGLPKTLSEMVVALVCTSADFLASLLGVGDRTNLTTEQKRKQNRFSGTTDIKNTRMMSLLVHKQVKFFGTI